MIAPIQPGGGHKAGVVHTHFLGCAVHFGNERLRAAGKKDGCRIGSVVAADQQHAYHQIVQRDPIPTCNPKDEPSVSFSIALL